MELRNRSLDRVNCELFDFFTKKQTEGNQSKFQCLNTYGLIAFIYIFLKTVSKKS